MWIRKWAVSSYDGGDVDTTAQLAAVAAALTIGAQVPAPVDRPEGWATDREGFSLNIGNASLRVFFRWSAPSRPVNP